MAVFNVQRLADGRQFYNAVTLDDGQEKTPVASPGDTPISGERAAPANTGVSSFVRRPLARVNPATVSKVIDPDTGEPLVVYHATDNEFTAFDFARLGEVTRTNAVHDEAVITAELGTWANTRPLAGDTAQRIDMPLFLSIRSPSVTRFDELWANSAMYRSGQEMRAALEAEGYDGIEVDDSEFGGTKWQNKNSRLV